MTLNFQATSLNPTLIARQPGVGGSKPARPILPQRLIPTANLKPLGGNGLDSALRNAARNGFPLNSGTPVFSNGVINTAIVQGKVKIVGLNGNVDVLQLADQMFIARGLTSNDRSKELVPGFTVGQYLQWRDATIAFNKEESGIGTNSRGKQLAETADVFEKKLVRALNMMDLPPELQAAELKRVQEMMRDLEAKKKERRAGRECKLVTTFTYRSLPSGKVAAAAATAVEAQKSGFSEPTAVVQARQRITPSTQYTTEGSSDRRAGTTLRSEATDNGRAIAANSFIAENNRATAVQESSGVCTWADGQQLVATPVTGNATPPRRATGWYTEVRSLLGL
jgi:hypothetical protein